MVLIMNDEPRAAGTEPRSDGQGGPVFLPPRQLSPVARAILSTPAENERVTAYDELWYRGRPQRA
jgi:hypothetical protein